MPNLHETPMGKRFFETNVPYAIKQLVRIANSLESIAESLQAKQEKVEEIKNENKEEDKEKEMC